jgi:CDP-glucose 4,6-dehydratase
VALRYPQAVRPWQHVLDPIAGYLMLAQALIDNPADAPPAINFGPDADGVRPVRELVEALSRRWGGRPGWQPDPREHPHEAPLLTLDASRAQARLGWRPQLAFEDAVAWTADWYRAFWNGADAAEVTLRQIEAYAERLEQSPSDLLPRPGSTNSVDCLPNGTRAEPSAYVAPLYGDKERA